MRYALLERPFGRDGWQVTVVDGSWHVFLKTILNDLRKAYVQLTSWSLELEHDQIKLWYAINKNNLKFDPYLVVHHSTCR